MMKLTSFIVATALIGGVILFLITNTKSLQTTATPTPLPSSVSQEGRVGAGCKIGGCSGTICQNVEDEDAITTCEWREEYSCFADAQCAKQADGNCGWQQTEELQQCLQAQ